MEEQSFTVLGLIEGNEFVIAAGSKPVRNTQSLQVIVFCGWQSVGTRGYSMFSEQRQIHIENPLCSLMDHCQEKS